LAASVHLLVVRAAPRALIRPHFVGAMPATGTAGACHAWGEGPTWPTWGPRGAAVSQRARAHARAPGSRLRARPGCAVLPGGACPSGASRGVPFGRRRVPLP
jgi:hypothetical protein